jgi:hypothetical protein
MSVIDVKMKDWMQAVVFDQMGQVKQIHIGEDLITSAGKAAVAALILLDTATSASHFDWIAIGSDSTAATTSNTVLGDQRIRAASTGTRVTTSATNDTAQLVYVFASGKPAGLNGTSTGTQAIEESGVFNKATAGDLLCRQTFGALNIDWNGGDSLQITWKIQIS